MENQKEVSSSYLLEGLEIYGIHRTEAAEASNCLLWMHYEVLQEF